MLKYMLISKPKNHIPLRMAAQRVIRRETEEVTASEIYSLGASSSPTFTILKQKLGTACPKVMKYPNALPTAIPERKYLL